MTLAGLGSSVAGLTVTGGVDVEGVNSSVLDSTVTNPDGGPQADCINTNYAIAGAVLDNDDVSDCPLYGVVVSGGAQVQMSNDGVTQSRRGVLVQSGAVANLGTKGHEGRNTFSCNTDADLVPSRTWLRSATFWITSRQHRAKPRPMASPSRRRRASR